MVCLSCDHCFSEPSVVTSLEKILAEGSGKPSYEKEALPEGSDKPSCEGDFPVNLQVNPLMKISPGRFTWKCNVIGKLEQLASTVNVRPPRVYF